MGFKFNTYILFALISLFSTHSIDATSSSSETCSSNATAINLKSQMSAQEQRNAGLNRLSSSQIKSLENWISNWSSQQKEKATKTPPNAVAMVLSEGQFVKLGNGQVWTINSNAWIYTYYWKTGDPVTVGKSQDTLFPVSLTNENSGQSVSAKKPSKDVTESFKQSYAISKITEDGQFVELSNGSSWQVEPSARFMTQGWSSKSHVFVVKVKNVPGSVYELYNGDTARSVLVTQVKSAATPQPKKNSSSSNASQNTSQKPQS